jgi:hypothetical protein
MITEKPPEEKPSEEVEENSDPDSGDLSEESETV